jgi:hypothetical protein
MELTLEELDVMSENLASWPQWMCDLQLAALIAAARAHLQRRARPSIPQPPQQRLGASPPGVGPGSTKKPFPAQVEPSDDPDICGYRLPPSSVIGAYSVQFKSCEPDAGLVERCMAASHDDRLSTGALYREAAAALEAKDAEIARLREALRSTAAMGDIRIARAALKGGGV